MGKARRHKGIPTIWQLDRTTRPPTRPPATRVVRPAVIVKWSMAELIEWLGSCN